MTQPDNEAPRNTEAPRNADAPRNSEAAGKAKDRDLLGRILFWIFGPPTANDAITVHSPQAKAYLERQRAARKQQREQERARRRESR
ncbi:hypothetical protein ACNTMW_17335 [Planosporangium sp. 12N6]|uniref:hypothetical protein n=1 Tax=Planosporangium spinosum TaxID=3402278 RepID=UPI003CEC3876